ncbi:MAG TPA: rRNA maturation RNase YbeY [Patescibacteria group bacterium]|nr:rRNA maturation RNase YbeY [Patescibacteria group bacterium]
MTVNLYLSRRSWILKEKQIVKVLSAVMNGEKKRGAMSVHLVGVEKMRKLNAAYRGQDRVTDVLSFPTEDPREGEERDWGDIFLCPVRIKSQAKEWGETEKKEAGRMLVHGALHLLGYEHRTSKEKEKMFNKQERYLEKLI